MLEINHIHTYFDMLSRNEDDPNVYMNLIKCCITSDWKSGSIIGRISIILTRTQPTENG